MVSRFSVDVSKAGVYDGAIVFRLGGSGLRILSTVYMYCVGRIQLLSGHMASACNHVASYACMHICAPFLQLLYTRRVVHLKIKKIIHPSCLSHMRRTLLGDTVPAHDSVSKIRLFLGQLSTATGHSAMRIFAKSI
jgi:hypothetical protein